MNCSSLVFLHPYGGDCEKYCICMGGVARGNECPTVGDPPVRLHFNNALQLCVVPAAADCGRFPYRSIILV